MVYKNSAKLKAMARGKLLGKYSVVTGAFVLIQLIIFLTGSIVSSVSDTTTIAGKVMYSAISIIVELIATVFVVGELSIYLNLACGNEAKVSDVFSGFTKHPDKAILIKIITFFRTAVWLVPAIAAGLAYYFVLSDSMMLVVLIVLTVAGMIGSIYTAIRLSQSFYLLLDFPQYSASELIKFSWNIMKEHMGRYLYMMVSFIPIYLLGILSAGLGMLFIYPYQKMTFTEFYLDIIREPEKEEEAVINEVATDETPAPSFEAVISDATKLQTMEDENSDL